MSERVCAVVVTYNRKALLRECLLALQSQTRPVDEILVVDNASTDGTLAMLASDFPGCQVLALETNSGGAGGFHDGMRTAHDQGYEWLWLMDDDGRPAPDCLEQLLARQRPNTVLAPVQRDSRGENYGICVWRGMNVNVTNEILTQQRPLSGDYVFAFVGPLIPGSVVQRIGLPLKDLFIWYDDIEYALRILTAGIAETLVVPEAVFFHDFGGASKEVKLFGRTRLRPQQPAWKGYYSARNPLYIITRIKRSPQDFLRYFLIQLRFMGGDILYEPDRWKRVGLRLRGFWDGAFGRLGKRVAP